MPPVTPKKAATAATVQTPTLTQGPSAGPLAGIAARLDADKARAAAVHLSTYRSAIESLATGGTIAKEEEDPLAAALAFLELDTGTLTRDVATAKRVAEFRAHGSPLELAAKDSAAWEDVKASVAALERLRAELKAAEERHFQIMNGASRFGEMRNQLENLIASNPRIYGTWPPAPKPPAPPPHVNMPKNEVAVPPPPPPSEYKVLHPLLGREVTITPEVYHRLSTPTTRNVPLSQQDEHDRRMAERRNAIALKIEAESKAAVAKVEE